MPRIRPLVSQIERELRRLKSLPHKPANPEPILHNIHPVDRLQDLRKQIKALEAEADKIREPLLEDGADLNGDLYTGKVIESKRESIDTKAIIEAFGEEAIAPFLKTTQYKTLKITEK